MSLLDGLRELVVGVIGEAKPAPRPVSRGVRKYHYSRIFGNGRMKERAGAQRLKLAWGPTSINARSEFNHLVRTELRDEAVDFFNAMLANTKHPERLYFNRIALEQRGWI